MLHYLVRQSEEADVGITQSGKNKGINNIIKVASMISKLYRFTV